LPEEIRGQFLLKVYRYTVVLDGDTGALKGNIVSFIGYVNDTEQRLVKGVVGEDMRRDSRRCSWQSDIGCAS